MQTHMEDGVALWTPLGDCGPGVRLEVQVDVPVLFAHLLGHTPERLLVERLATAADVVDSSLAVRRTHAASVSIPPADVSVRGIAYLNTRLTSMGDVCTRTNSRT